MSCQPPQDSQTQVVSKYTFLNSSHIYINYPLSSQSTKTTHFANIKPTQISDTNFRRVSPFNITPVKRAHKARTCWYRRPFRLIYRYQIKEKKEKEKRNGQIKILYKCIMANTSAIWQLAAHTTYQLSSPSYSTKSHTKKPNLFWKAKEEKDH